MGNCLAKIWNHIYKRRGNTERTCDSRQLHQYRPERPTEIDSQPNLVIEESCQGVQVVVRQHEERNKDIRRRNATDLEDWKAQKTKQQQQERENLEAQCVGMTPAERKSHVDRLRKGQQVDARLITERRFMNNAAAVIEKTDKDGVKTQTILQNVEPGIADKVIMFNRLGPGT